MARNASFALTKKISGSNPRSARAFSATNAANLRDLRGPFEDVALVDDHDDFLAPPANVLHEAAFGLGEGAIGGRDEKHQIGAGNELRGHRLVLADDGVGAGGVDDADFAEQVDRRFDDEQVRLTHGLLRVVAVLEDGDHRCRRRDAFFHQRLADKGVDEGAFPGVELADDDEEKELVELGNRLVEGLLLVLPGVNPRKRGSKPHEQAALLAKQGVLPGRKHLRQHRDVNCTK